MNDQNNSALPDRVLSRRAFLRSSLCAVSAMALAGCGGGGGSSRSEASHPDVVIDTENGALRFDSLTGAYHGRFGVSNNLALSVRPDGAVFSSNDANNARVERFDRSTNASLGYTPLAGVPSSVYAFRTRLIAFRPDGYLYAARAGLGQEPDAVVRFDAQTFAFHDVFVPNRLLPPPLRGPSNMNSIHDMAFDSQGSLYLVVSDSYYGDQNLCILRFRAGTGAPFPATGRTGAFFLPIGGLPSCTNIAFDAKDNLYATLVDYTDPTRAVVRLHAGTGLPYPAPGLLGGAFTSGISVQNASGLAFAPDGSLLVSDRSGQKVLRYDGQSGKFRDVFATKEQMMPPSQYSLPPNQPFPSRLLLLPS